MLFLGNLLLQVINKIISQKKKTQKDKRKNLVLIMKTNPFKYLLQTTKKIYLLQTNTQKHRKSHGKSSFLMLKAN